MTRTELNRKIREASRKLWHCTTMGNEVCADSWTIRLQELCELEVSDEQA